MQEHQLQAEPIAVLPGSCGPNTVVSLYPFISDVEMAALFRKSVSWVREHGKEIPGHQQLTTSYRFRREPVIEWLGGLEELLDAEQIAYVLQVPACWIEANARSIPGALRIGNVLRFRPASFLQWLKDIGICR